MTDVTLSRRQALLGTAALAGAATLGGLPLSSALARAPFAADQAPYFYRFAHGSMQATVVSDGILPLGDPSGTFLGASKEEIGKMLSDNFLSPTNVVLEQNVLVLNTGDKLVLFDTGMGSSPLFGPTPGKLLANLKAAGIDPKDIDAVVATHAHCDHVWGIMADNGSRNFPNAQLYISQTDFDFWTDEAKLAIKDPAYMQPFIEGARKNLLPNRDRLIFVKDGQEFLPGIQAMSAPGHTVGHTMYMITSEGKSLAAVGDLTHHQVILLQRPRIEFSFDTDPKQSADTRVRILAMLAANRIPLLAYHFPWPGVGHVSNQGEGFRFHPTPLQMVLERKG
ncbi:MAG TPA: MBL fold metallo-hydrolase [Burkholderiales bacterium]|nr:MBL fold metallo-hydrolase [Burkholderiales bacterium]